MSSDDLIQRCQQGDSDAFDTMINEQYDTIYRIAYRWCNDQHNAQDIAQQASIKLARSIKQFRFESNFNSWLYRLVINCAKDFYKSPNQFNHSEQESNSTLRDPAYTTNRVENLHYARQILEHINHLPCDLKDAIVLVFGKGLNHRQAASELNIKESTVSWRVHEARKLLKQTFESTTLSEHSADTARGAV